LKQFLKPGGFADTALIAVAAAVEGAAGLTVIVDPTFLVRLLWATAVPSSQLALARLAGIALLALAVACWPARNPGLRNDAAIRGLLTYNSLAGILFAYIGIRGEYVGWLLWPAVAFHATVAVLLARALLAGRR